MTNEEKIINKANEIRDLLVAKNMSYGDSALNPIHVFGKQSSIDGLCQRIDDKLSRIRNSGYENNIDTVKDLAGYLVLLLIAFDNKGVTQLSKGKQLLMDSSESDSFRVC